MGFSKAQGHRPALPWSEVILHSSSSVNLKHRISNAPFTLTLSSPSIFLQISSFLTLRISAVLYFSRVWEETTLILSPHSHWESLGKNELRKHWVKEKKKLPCFSSNLGHIFNSLPTSSPSCNSSIRIEEKVKVGKWKEWLLRVLGSGTWMGNRRPKKLPVPLSSPREPAPLLQQMKQISPLLPTP